MTLEQQPRCTVHIPSNGGSERAPEPSRTEPTSYSDLRLPLGLRPGVMVDQNEPPATPIKRDRGTSHRLLFEWSANRRRSNGRNLSEFQIHTEHRISAYGHHRAQSRREPARPSAVPPALT
jgi:hypothetical protein